MAKNGLQTVSTDRRVGQITEGSLVGQVSMRGQTVVCGFIRGPRGWEVSFSPGKAREFAMMILDASDKLGG